MDCHGRSIAYKNDQESFEDFFIYVMNAAQPKMRVYIRPPDIIFDEKKPILLPGISKYKNLSAGDPVEVIPDTHSFYGHIHKPAKDINPGNEFRIFGFVKIHWWKKKCSSVNSLVKRSLRNEEIMAVLCTQYIKKIRTFTGGFGSDTYVILFSIQNLKRKGHDHIPIHLRIP